MYKMKKKKKEIATHASIKIEKVVKNKEIILK